MRGAALRTPASPKILHLKKQKGITLVPGQAGDVGFGVQLQASEAQQFASPGQLKGDLGEG